MTKNFRKKTKSLMKKLVKEKGLKLYTMKIFLGECSKDTVIEMSDFLIGMWLKICRNHFNVFFKWFCGWTRELIIEVDGDICRPYLFFVLFAERMAVEKNAGLKKLNYYAFLMWLRISMQRELERNNFAPLEEVPAERYDEVLDDLMLPCIRVIQSNPEVEEILEMYQYNRQLCSRGGIVSRRNLERNLALDVER